MSRSDSHNHTDSVYGSDNDDSQANPAVLKCRLYIQVAAELNEHKNGHTKKHADASDSQTYLANKLDDLNTFLTANQQITLCDAADSAQLMLLVGHSRLSLQLPGMKPLSLDYTDTEQRHRLQHISRKQEPLLQALAAKPGMHIIDATAGTGRDGTLLAAYGCKVLMYERNPVLFLLLENALQRMQQDPKLGHMAARCSLQRQALFTHIEPSANLSDLKQADAIYLDPMFPERRKQAKVKKLAQILHILAGQDDDQTTMARNALDFARTHHQIKRMVIKRPRIAPYLTKHAPDHQIIGRSTRFDIYFTAK